MCARQIGASCLTVRAFFGEPLQSHSSDTGIVRPEAEVEAAVAADMAAQQRWVDALRPLAALLKFRLPWDIGITRYLAGAGESRKAPRSTIC